MHLLNAHSNGIARDCSSACNDSNGFSEFHSFTWNHLNAQYTH